VYPSAVKTTTATTTTKTETNPTQKLMCLKKAVPHMMAQACNPFAQEVEIKVSLGYMVRPCLNKNNKTKTQQKKHNKPKQKARQNKTKTISHV
jgi:hypothetical protein